MKRVAAALLVLVSLVALGGCSAVSTLFNTESALRDAGYQSVSVNTSFSGSVSTVKVSVTVQALPSTGTVNDVASIVWQKFHERFDYLHITVHGDGQTESADYNFDQVQALFGPRNPSWNKTSVRSAYTDVGLEILVGVAVLALIIVAIILLTTRRRRRQQAPAGWPGWPGGYPYGAGVPYGPPGGPGSGPPPPGYGPPPAGYGPPPPGFGPPPPGYGPPGGPPGAGHPPGGSPAPGAGPPPDAGYPLWEPPSYPPSSPAPTDPPPQSDPSPPTDQPPPGSSSE